MKGHRPCHRTVDGDAIASLTCLCGDLSPLPAAPFEWLKTCLQWQLPRRPSRSFESSPRDKLADSYTLRTRRSRCARAIWS